MSTQDEKGHGAYVHKVREGTQRYAQDLIAENERLRMLVAGAEAASRRALEEFREIEQQNTNLANLYVASYRLHGTLERDGVLSAISEIVANLIGSEEMGVFEVRSDRAALCLIGQNGIDPARYRELPVDIGWIGRVATTGETYIRDRDGALGATPLETNLTACIPLKVEGTVIGVLAIFSLLPQKSQIEELDHELFDVLASQAGMALYCTTLYARLQTKGEAVA